MKKIVSILFGVLLVLFVFVSCDSDNTTSNNNDKIQNEHTHSWVAATCTTPKTCSTCNHTEGSSLGHNWIEATCTKAKTCNTCNKTEGSSLGHSWIEATCSSPKKCSNCSEKVGKADIYAHDGIGQCSLCKKNYFDILRDFIMIDGTLSYGKWFVIEHTMYYNGKSYGFKVEYNTDNGEIYLILKEAYNSKSYDFTIVLSNASGNYEYSYTDLMGSSLDSAGGTIKASSVNKDSTSLTFDRFKCNDGKHSQALLEQKCAILLHSVLYCWDKCMREEGLGITIENFGFINYNE